MKVYGDLVRAALFLCPAYWAYRLVRQQTRDDYRRQWKEKN